MGGREESEDALWLHRGHSEGGLSWRAVGDCIADREVLEFRDDPIGACRVAGMPNILVNPLIPALVGVPPAAVIAHLHQPRPDGGTRSTNDHRMRHFHHRMGHEVVTGQRPIHFSFGRSPALTQATQHIPSRGEGKQSYQQLRSHSKIPSFCDRDTIPLCSVMHGLYREITVSGFLHTNPSRLQASECWAIE